MSTEHAALQTAAIAWFADLRDRLCAAFEAIEDDPNPLDDRPAGRFTRTVWSRPAAGRCFVGGAA
jgi:coproporphyrinogen III oxidase